MQIFAILQPFSQYPWVPTFIIQFGNHSNNTIWQHTILFGNKSLTLLQQRTAQCTITNLDTLMILLPVIILLPTLRILSPTLRILLPTITSKERDFLARQYWLRRQLMFGIGRILLQIPSANAAKKENCSLNCTPSPPLGPLLHQDAKFCWRSWICQKLVISLIQIFPFLLMTHQTQQTIRAKIHSKNFSQKFCTCFCIQHSTYSLSFENTTPNSVWGVEFFHQNKN